MSLDLAVHTAILTNQWKSNLVLSFSYIEYTYARERLLHIYIYGSLIRFRSVFYWSRAKYTNKKYLPVLDKIRDWLYYGRKCVLLRK